MVQSAAGSADAPDDLDEKKDHRPLDEADIALLKTYWDLVQDKQMMQEEQPLQVARCTKIINPNTEDAKYVINVRQIAKFVVGLGDRVAPTDIEEGMRVGVDRNKYQIQIPLPPKARARPARRPPIVLRGGEGG
ncbi:hypothetical protein T492DRAFT_468651 [Pavlovales sp. CCMP2436]|nr:hypothetical protein T492DRAFT_468651 [Pavlovales sp. CCMP2436]